MGVEICAPRYLNGKEAAGICKALQTVVLNESPAHFEKSMADLFLLMVNPVQSVNNLQISFNERPRPASKQSSAYRECEKKNDTGKK